MWGELQNRTSAYLLLNNLIAAAMGLLFWLVFTRVLDAPAAEIGLGYTIVAFATMVAVLAKGGLDTAIVRILPTTDHAAGKRLVLIAVCLGAGVALAVAALLAGLTSAGFGIPGLDAQAWGIMAALSALLVVMWLQDASFLAQGAAGRTATRTAIMSTVRLAAPWPAVILAWAHPVAASWTVAILVSVVLGMWWGRSKATAPGGPAPIAAFMTTATRNLAGSAAEFLPGLLLAPIVLALEGAEAAAYFGIAWTVASLLFLASGAVSRSAMASMVGADRDARARAVRRAALQHLAIVAPCATMAIMLAPQLLGIFGAEYATQAWRPLVLLCASIVVVAPGYLYLAVLRAGDGGWRLILFPAALLAVIFAIVPTFQARWGLTGVAAAWFVANAPFGLWATWRLIGTTQGVNAVAHPTLAGPSHSE